MNNKLFRLLLGNPVVRAITRLIMLIAELLARMANYARARALFPNSDVIVAWNTEVKFPENITLGRGVVIGTNCTLGASAPIFIGDKVLFSKGCFVDTGSADITTAPPYAKMSRPIRIENGVWLGANAMIMAGVTIGENSIIAAGTIVRKSVPPNSYVISVEPRVQAFGVRPPGPRVRTKPRVDPPSGS